MAKLTYFPLLMDRWIAGTKTLTFEQKGFYIDLLVYLYDTGEAIKDEAHAARITGCDPRTSRRLLADLQGKFYRRSDGLRHKLVTEILKNGGKVRYLGHFENLTELPLKPDPEEEEEEKKNLPTEGKKKRSPVSQRAQGQSPRQQGTNPREMPPLAEPLPVDGLDMGAWEAYEDYRRQAKLKKLQPASVTRLQRWLVEQPDQAAVVDQTIRNGWNGLFELKTEKPKRYNGAGRKQSFTEMVEALGRDMGVPPKAGEDWGPYYARLQDIQRRAH